MKKSIIAIAALTMVFAACSSNKKKEAVAPVLPTNAVSVELVKPIYNLTIITSDYSTVGGEDFQLTEGIRQVVKGEVNKKFVKYEDAKAMEEFKNLNLDYMPLYLLERTEETYKSLEQFIQRGALKEVGNYIVFEHQTRAGVFMNEPVKKNTLEIFVMSQCPYGVMAINRVIEAQKAKEIGKDIKIKLRYLASIQGDSFRSLHGSAEWEEDIRQLLVAKYYPNSLWKYLEIRNKDYQSSMWPAAFQKAGIPMDKINKEFDTTGKKLLKEDISYSEKYGASASPMYLWEGRVLADTQTLSNIKGLEFLAPKPQVNAPGVIAPQQADQGGSC